MTHPTADRRGGIERVVVECANQLDARGHQVHVYATRWDPAVLSPGIRLHRVATRRRPDFLVSAQYRRRATESLARAWQSTDVHASFGALSPLGGVYWIPSVHLIAYEQALSRRGPAAAAVQRANPYHRIRLRYEREMYAPGGYARLLAASDSVKRDAIERYGVPEADVEVLPLGYDAEQFHAGRRAPLRAASRRRLGYADEHRVVLFVANELERKGFDTLLRAVAALRRPEVRLLVVGRVDVAAQQKLIGSLGLTGRVTAVGPADDVAEYHAAADVFALPTRYEPWGLVVVEALASGLPVLTSRLAGAAVAVRPGRTGALLEDPDDVEEAAEALRALLDGPPADPAEISASVQWLSWNQIIRRYEEILAAATKGAP